MKSRILSFSLGVIIAAALPAMSLEVDLSNIPTETKILCEKFIAQYTGSNDHWEAEAKLVKALAEAPGGDLCFLKAIVPNTMGSKTTTARKQLGQLNTQRTFDYIVTFLKSPNSLVRENAIWAVSAFNRPECVTLLVDILENDANQRVKRLAAEAIGKYADKRAENALLKAAKGDSKPIAIFACQSLAPLRSKEGLSIAIGLLEQVDKTELEWCITAISHYRNKESISALIKKFSILCAEKEALERRVAEDNVPDNELLKDKLIWAKRICSWTAARLRDVAYPLKPVLGPVPDDFADEWEDWWIRAEPLLTDDLVLKHEVPEPRNWENEEFADSADDLVLTASVDAGIFRVGDPIRLDLVMSNKGKFPCKTVLPRLPSGWMPTMAYGVKLKRDNQMLIEIEPSPNYLGSYSGPPGFNTLGPGELFHSSICLQYWLSWYQNVTWPLGEGDYELTIVFDSSKFAGIESQGVQQLHRWEAPVVEFNIKGEARKDPEEILTLIAKKSKLKFLARDLMSSQLDRKEPALQALIVYGDTRLVPLIEEMCEIAEQSNLSFRFNPEILRSYE